MKHFILWYLIGLLWMLGGCGGSQHEKTQSKVCSKAQLIVGGNEIWVNREGEGDITVVFEAGFGNDSSVWSQIAPKVREAGVRTFVYDRAGLGKSIIDTSAPYSIDNDVHILRRVLTSCDITGAVVMVGHAYGGGISLVAASQDERIRGIVLLDAMVPKVFANGELENNMKSMRAQYGEIRTKEPQLALVAIPWTEALPKTVQRVDEVELPPRLPIIDVVAERGSSSEEGAEVWHEAHAAFTANRPYREYILANGTSHDVMMEGAPELVIREIRRMVDQVRNKPRRVD
jgi:hypothetical protein